MATQETISTGDPGASVQNASAILTLLQSITSLAMTVRDLLNNDNLDSSMGHAAAHLVSQIGATADHGRLLLGDTQIIGTANDWLDLEPPHRVVARAAIQAAKGVSHG